MQCCDASTKVEQGVTSTLGGRNIMKLGKRPRLSVCRQYVLRTGCCWLVLLGVLWNIPQPATAQSDRGTITGTVFDPAGASVPNAAVTLKSVERGAVYNTVTTGTGNYTVPSLPAGRYDLTVTASGFTQYIQQG